MCVEGRGGGVCERVGEREGETMKISELQREGEREKEREREKAGIRSA